LLSAALRVPAFFRYRVDSDEPQHLHVAWGWTAGLLPYRDLFDNHAPLFHMLTAPILALAGERPDIVRVMRAPMMLLFAAVLVSTYAIGRRLYSPRVALWSVVLLSLLPPFFLKSLEYRTDNLWNAFWMVACAVLAGGELTLVRLFVAGLLLGCALATSMKTIVLIVTLAVSAVMTYAWCVRDRRWGRAALRALPVLAGIAVVPAAAAMFFIARGGWNDLVRCVFGFNTLVERLEPPGRLLLRHLLFVPALILVLRVAWRHRGSAVPWRFFFAFATAFFAIALVSFWIWVSPRDLLPILPFLTLFAVAAVERSTRPRIAIYAVASALFAVMIVRDTSLLRDRCKGHIAMMRDVLRLTRPGEPLLDLKGETVFRRRPFYPVLELITRRAMVAGLIADTIPEDVIRTRCMVAQQESEFWPPRGQKFLAANFIAVGRLRVTGQWLKPDGSFSVAVPGVYVLLCRDGQAQGVLDGTPVRGARALAAGMHSFVSNGTWRRTALLWAGAWSRGFSPFQTRSNALE
jgi:hypothetical protein